MLKQYNLMVCLVVLSLPVLAEISDPELVVAIEQAAGKAEFRIRGQSGVDEVIYAEIKYQLPVSLVTGGSIVLRQLSKEVRRLQIGTRASTNFVRLVTSEPLGAQLLAREVEGKGIAGEPGYQASAIAFEVTSGVLQAGTILRLIVDRLQLPTTAMLHYEIPLYLKNTQEASLARVPSNSIQI